MDLIQISVWDDDNKEVEPTDETFNHINMMIMKGYTSGEIIQQDECKDETYRGFWSLKKNQDIKRGL